MCLIFLSLHDHPTYKLVVAANRDEFYKRRTAPAAFWEDHSFIVGGRDLEASGTWMAMSKYGKIGMVTNYRDPHNINPQAPSRGQLVSDFLVNGDLAHRYMNEVAQRGKAYNGFNLITGTPEALYYYSNYQGTVEAITPGLHGLSNHLLNTPWPKVERGKEKMKQVLSSRSIDPDDLFELLYDEQRATDDRLPDTGIGLERERALSSMFIKTNGYGSRCSTVVLIDRDNHVQYLERVYDLDTFSYQKNAFSFTIERAMHGEEK
jgi:uncharacterized protein with NRDE domain